MALQLPILADDNVIGFDFPEVYARVGNHSGNKTQLQVQVNFWACQDAAQKSEHGCIPIRQEAYYIPIEELDGSSLVGSVYAWLKANVEIFTGAVDV